MGSRALSPRTGPSRAVPSAHRCTCGVRGSVLCRGRCLGRPWPFCPRLTFPASPGLCPPVCPPASVPTVARQWKGARGSFSAAWGSGGVTHTASSPTFQTRREVSRDPLASLTPKFTRSPVAFRAVQAACVSRAGGWAWRRHTPSTGGWEVRAGGGACWGPAPPPFFTQSSFTPPVLCSDLGVNQPEAAPPVCAEPPRPPHARTPRP